MANLAGVISTIGEQFYSGKPISPEEFHQERLPPYLPLPKLINAVNFAIFKKGLT
ncbi:MAG: hypothetical protein F6K31_29395 [Symploca sp. SIO2G7]|nr:hypothetical protein [Symploca sp. SIO2G7]